MRRRARWWRGAGFRATRRGGGRCPVWGSIRRRRSRRSRLARRACRWTPTSRAWGRGAVRGRILGAGGAAGAAAADVRGAGGGCGAGIDGLGIGGVRGARGGVRAVSAAGGLRGGGFGRADTLARAQGEGGATGAAGSGVLAGGGGACADRAAAAAWASGGDGGAARKCVGDGADALVDAPVVADWRVLDERVAHTFTHFHLDLGIARAKLPGARQARRRVGGGGRAGAGGAAHAICEGGEDCGVLGFTGSPIDRAESLRRDEAGIAAARVDPRARFLVLEELKPGMDVSGAVPVLGWMEAAQGA